MAKQKCRFIFKTNGTLKWSNLIDQKIPHISEFVIRVNMCLYKNQICLKKNPTFLFYPGFLCEGLRYERIFFLIELYKLYSFKFILIEFSFI